MKFKPDVNQTRGRPAHASALRLTSSSHGSRRSSALDRTLTSKISVVETP